MSQEKKTVACVECREKKLRCVPSQEECGSCQRCIRLGRDCHTPEVKRRERKAKLRGRVDRLESNYSEIITLLKQSNPSGPISPHSEAQQIQASSALVRPQSEHLPEVAGNQSSDNTLTLDTSPPPELENAIEYYRRICQSQYPWVIIPQDRDASSLYKERPMLARAIVIATSWATSEHHLALKSQFLKDIGESYLIRTEKSIDLLQAVLVYLGWCHRFSNPWAAHTPRLAWLAEQMAVELDIIQRPLNSTQHDLIVYSNWRVQQRNESSASSDYWGYDARRSFVGAYTLSIFGLLITRKPTTLANTKYLDESITALAESPQYSSDAFLSHYVRLHKISAQVVHTFDEGSRDKATLSDDKIQILVGTLIQELEQWKSALPSAPMDGVLADDISAKMLTRINREYHSCRAFIYEVGLYGLLEGQKPSITRISMIFECLNASMSFLTSAVEDSLQEMTDWTSIEWRALNFAVMLSTRSSIILECSSATIPQSSYAAQLDRYLDIVCARAKELQQMAESMKNYENCFKRYATDWSSVRSLRQKCIQQHNNHIAATSTSGPMASQIDFQPYDQQMFDINVFSDQFWTGFGEQENMPASFF